VLYPDAKPLSIVRKKPAHGRYYR